MAGLTSGRIKCLKFHVPPPPCPALLSFHLCRIRKVFLCVSFVLDVFVYSFEKKTCYFTVRTCVGELVVGG